MLLTDQLASVVVLYSALSASLQSTNVKKHSIKVCHSSSAASGPNTGGKRRREGDPLVTPGEKSNDDKRDLGDSAGKALSVKQYRYPNIYWE